jgi:hypothetical protein
MKRQTFENQGCRLDACAARFFFVRHFPGFLDAPIFPSPAHEYKARHVVITLRVMRVQLSLAESAFRSISH